MNSTTQSGPMVSHKGVTSIHQTYDFASLPLRDPGSQKGVEGDRGKYQKNRSFIKNAEKIMP